MAIRFEVRSLKDENGKVYLISYRKVLEECLKHPYHTLSISTIVYETIERMTGERLIKNKHIGNPLYCWLEKHIKSSERYQQQKELEAKRDAEIRQKIKENKRLDIDTINPRFLEAHIRKEHRNLYRTKRRDTE